MKIKNIFKEMPTYPLSVLAFYITVIILWNIGIIPPPKELVIFLEKLYDDFGLFGVFISTMLEGLAYVGLYFPGTTILFLAFVFSKGDFLSLFYLILVATSALTIDSIINYWAGRYFRHKRTNNNFKKQGAEKSLFFAVLHPNLLSFYFFHRGLKKKNFWKVFIVPIILIIYGLILAFILSFFSGFVKSNLVGNPYFIISAILVWFFISLLMQHKEDFNRGIKRIYKHLIH